VNLPATGWLALTVLCFTSAAVLAVLVHDWWQS
jgi:hypothetical protein